MIVVPNGVDTHEVKPVARAKKAEIRERLKLPDRTIVLFIGAWHPPNLEAFQFILETMAPQCPTLQFIVMGSVKAQYEARIGKLDAPGNVLVLGEVDEQTRLDVLAAADIGVNPMFTGSGTNLKILEYFAAGLCVISTQLGIRGLDINPSQDVILADKKSFHSVLNQAVEQAEHRAAIGKAARIVAESKYAWSVIADQVIEGFEACLCNTSTLNIQTNQPNHFPFGWYQPEEWQINDQAVFVRWAEPVAQLFIPNLHAPGRLYLNVQGKTGGSSLSIYKGSVMLFDDVISETWQSISIDLKLYPGSDYLRLNIISEAWSPSDTGSSDERVLGIALSEIKIEKT